ncbi:hypothetical protein [Fischerella sp. PCC 9605]|nr:hypothetical protein [Fischerella sp. PCC 9605]
MESKPNKLIILQSHIAIAFIASLVHPLLMPHPNQDHQKLGRTQTA